MTAIRGSCLCGDFRFEIQGPILFLKNCHCSRCRKMTGSTFATYARADINTLKVLSGADGITTYERCPGNVIAAPSSRIHRKNRPKSSSSPVSSMTILA
jgi:hypothetical protein